jgi:hypothetical protein
MGAANGEMFLTGRAVIDAHRQHLGGACNGQGELGDDEI